LIWIVNTAVAPHVSLSVGDWFFAESLAGGPVRGVLHTVFTAHAPTVNRQVADFDHKLASVLKDHGLSASESRRVALEKLRKRIRELPAHPLWTDD
jgi:hypothetical protein